MSHHDEDYQRDVNRTPASEPLYCSYCGWKLVPNDTITEYNTKTGEPIRPFLGQKHCRNRNCNSKKAWFAYSKHTGHI